MAFDKAEPQDTTKIRNLGVVIRPNWVAIEQADDTFRPIALNLQNRTPDPSANDPGTLANTSKIYVKDDSAANPELFSKDGSGNIIQMSEVGKLGSKNTAMAASNITFDDAGFSVDNANIVTAWGYFNSSGVFQHGQNMATAGSPHPSTGVYNLITTAVFNNSSVGVSLTTFRPSSSTPASINLVTVPSVAANKVSFQVETKKRDGSHANLKFYCLIIGGI